jgi:hypothetical protein
MFNLFNAIRRMATECDDKKKVFSSVYPNDLVFFEYFLVCLYFLVLEHDVPIFVRFIPGARYVFFCVFFLVESDVEHNPISLVNRKRAIAP